MDLQAMFPDARRYDDDYYIYSLLLLKITM